MSAASQIVTAGGEVGPRVDVALDPVLATAVEGVGATVLREDVAAHIAGVMTAFGVPGVPCVQVTSQASSRMVTVRAQGRVVPYPAAFLRRLWFSVAPPRLRPLATVVGDAYPDRWMAACADGVRNPDAPLALKQLLARLPADVLTLAPSRLLTAGAVEALTGADGPPADVAREILERVLDMEVALPDGPLGTLLSGLLATGMSPADVVDSLYDRLRRSSIDLLLDVVSFDELAPGVSDGRVSATDPRVDPALAAAISAIRTERFEELGIRIPVVLARDDELGPDEIRMRLDDRVGLPIPVPRRGELGVTAPIAALTAIGVNARPLVDAVTGFELAAVRSDAAPAVAAAGLLAVSRSAYVAAALGRTVSMFAARVLAAADIEAELAAFEETSPSLVHDVLARRSYADLTRLLRALAREQVSTRDLAQILGAVLEHDVLREASPAAGDDDADLLRAVREALGARVVFDTGQLSEFGAAPLLVYETAADFEAVVAEAYGGATLDETQCCRIRDRIWSTLGISPPAEPVLLTSTRVRPWLHQAIGVELPGARVLARAEIPPGVMVQRLGWVGDPAA